MSGARPVLLEPPQRVGAVGERAREPALVAVLGRHRAHAQRDAGDHAERALGADDELAQRRPGGARGRAERGQLARRRGAAQRDDVLVDPAVPGRGLPGGAGRDAAADRRPLEALGHVREPQPVGAERALGLRQPQARGRAPRSASARRPTRRRPSARGRARPRPRSPRAAPRGRRRRSCRRRTARPPRPAPRRSAARRRPGRGRPGARPRRARPRSRPRAARAGRGSSCRGSAGRASRASSSTCAAPTACSSPRRAASGSSGVAQPHVGERDRRLDGAAGQPELLAQEGVRVLGQRRPRAGLAPAPEDLLPHVSAPLSPSSASSSRRRVALRIIHIPEPRRPAAALGRPSASPPSRRRPARARPPCGARAAAARTACPPAPATTPAAAAARAPRRGSPRARPCPRSERITEVHAVRVDGLHALGQRPPARQVVRVADDRPDVVERDRHGPRPRGPVTPRRRRSASARRSRRAARAR